MSDTTTPPPLPGGAATAQLQTALSNALGFPAAPAWNGTDAKTNVVALLRNLCATQAACLTTLTAIQAALTPQQQQQNQQPSLPLVAAARSSDFLNTIGVNILPNWSGWNNPAPHVAGVNYLGARVVRTGWYQPGVNSATLDALKANGTKFLVMLTISDGTSQWAAMPGRIQDTLNALGSSILGWEGPNECNMENNGLLDSLGRNCKDSDGSGNNGVVARQIMIDLRNAIDSVLGANAYPLIAPALWVGGSQSNTQNYLAKMGDLTGICDHGNWHPYANVNGFMVQPGSAVNGIGQATTYVHKEVPGAGGAYTEFGVSPDGQSYEQAGSSSGGKMLLNYYADAFQNKCFVTTGFEMFDVTQEGFGLLNTDGSPRQTAATYLHNFTTILADSGTVATPAALPLSVPAGLNCILLHRSDNAHDVILWNETPVADGAGHDVEATPTTGTLQLGSAATVSVFDPTVGTNPVSTMSGASVPVSIAGYPQILRVTP